MQNTDMNNSSIDSDLIIDKIKNYVAMNGNQLFSFNKKLFKKEIIICDMEMNGSTYKPEILEICCIKIKCGRVIDSLFLESKLTTKIRPEVLMLLSKNESHYKSRDSIEINFPKIKSFLDINSYICFYSPAYDLLTLKSIYKNFKSQFPNFKIIDAQNLMKIVSARTKQPSLDFMIQKSDMNLFFKKYQKHSAILDVYKIIVIMKEIDMALYSKNIKFENIFRKAYKKASNK